MSEYKRFVSYVYEYRNGKKSSSCGVVKAEIKDSICHLEIRLRIPGLAAGGKYRVYGFVRKDGLMNGILLGTCIAKQDKLECMIRDNPKNLNHSGTELDKLGGILITGEKGGFWGTQWDDESIRPENFREWKLPEEKEPEQKAVSQESEQKEEIPKKEEILQKEEGFQKEEKEVEIEEFINEDEKKGELTSESVPPPAPPRPCGRSSDSPFDDCEFQDCKKIRPSDCRHFCKRERGLCSNRFALYGYENFGHLLLCHTRRGKYILGVPGVYNQQERFMAGMFGFPYFKESRRIRVPGAKGGYWYCFISGPEKC